MCHYNPSWLFANQNVWNECVLYWYYQRLQQISRTNSLWWNNYLNIFSSRIYFYNSVFRKVKKTYLRSWGGWSRGLRSFSFLLALGLHLGEDGGRVDTPSLKVALEGEQVLAVVLLKGVGPAGAGPYPQLRRYVLPRLLVRALKHTKY